MEHVARVQLPVRGVDLGDKLELEAPNAFGEPGDRLRASGHACQHKAARPAPGANPAARLVDIGDPLLPRGSDPSSGVRGCDRVGRPGHRMAAAPLGFVVILRKMFTRRIVCLDAGAGRPGGSQAGAWRPATACREGAAGGQGPARACLDKSGVLASRGAAPGRHAGGQGPLAAFCDPRRARLARPPGRAGAAAPLPRAARVWDPQARQGF